MKLTLPPGTELLSSPPEEVAHILTTYALSFVADLERSFRAERERLLSARQIRQAEISGGKNPDFLSETADIRAGDWKIRGVPTDLLERRVEITGPVDRKIVINALNSGADVFMADFEDSNAPTWENALFGQMNMYDAVRRTINYEVPGGKSYALNPKIATLLVRPRGWHLSEKHFIVDGKAVSGGIFDFGLYVFHNGHETLKRGTGPYFYLPKLENHLEARLWNGVFVHAQEKLGLPIGTIKATVLIETIVAAFEMDEILYELRDHIVGLNCGRWDYIFSIIKKFAARPEFILPDRASITMTTRALRSYSQLLIQTCHKRGAFAMGGMAAQIPIKNDEAANELAMSRVRADKEREAKDGHDGTWVAHPALVPIAKAEFDRFMTGPNQLNVMRNDVSVTAADLLAIPEGEITEKGVRLNIDVGLQYTAAWLCGTGCVPIYNLMEDAATAEISRSQLWQWLRHGAKLADGRRFTNELYNQLAAEEIAKHRGRLGEIEFAAQKYPQAFELLNRITTADNFVEFLTLPAYELL